MEQPLETNSGVRIGKDDPCQGRAVQRAIPGEDSLTELGHDLR